MGKAPAIASVLILDQRACIRCRENHDLLKVRQEPGLIRVLFGYVKLRERHGG